MVTGAPVDELHVFTARFAKISGYEKLGDGVHLVHHKRPNKKNNRVENLRIHTRADHACVHRLLEKAKREKYDIAGLWRPHQPGRPSRGPGCTPPRSGDAKTAREVYANPRSWDSLAERLLTTAEQLRRGRTRRLAASFLRLDAATRHMDSGKKIPRSRFRASRSTMLKLGLEPVTLGCTVAEAALVRALVLHQRPDSRSFDIDATGQDVDVHPNLLRIDHVPASGGPRHRALESYGRLPKACANESTRPRPRPAWRA